MKTSQNTVWAVGAGVLAVLLVVATYFLVITPKRSEAADLQTQRVSVEQTNAEIQQRTAQLQTQFTTLDEKKRELETIESQLPSTAEVPALLRQVSGFATAAGVRIDQVTPGAPEAYGASSSAAGAAAAGGIVSIPLTIAVTGSFAQVELYVKNLQADMPRHFSITGLTVATDQSASTAGGVSATLTGAIFVLQSSNSTVGATSTTSGTTPTPTGSSAATGTTTTATVS